MPWPELVEVSENIASGTGEHFTIFCMDSTLYPLPPLQEPFCGQFPTPGPGGRAREIPGGASVRGKVPGK